MRPLTRRSPRACCCGMAISRCTSDRSICERVRQQEDHVDDAARARRHRCDHSHAARRARVVVEWRSAAAHRIDRSVSAGGSKKITSTTQLELAVIDATTHTPLAARVLLWNGDQPLHIGSIDLYGQRQGATACEFAPGVIGTWDGIVLATGAGMVPVGVDRCAPTPAIPYGHYKVWAWHGIDHDIWKGEIDLSANRGNVAVEIPLERAWTAGPNVVAADM